MSTQVTPPVNVIAGGPNKITPPGYSDVGNAVTAVVIYNTTSIVLQVNASSGVSFLQPLTADVFECNTISSAPTVTPVTNQAVGVYLGTLTCTFYFQGDKPPVGFPLPLNPFPGGANLIETGVQLIPGVFQVPAGTTSITISGTNGAPGQILSLSGNQSGNIYYGPPSGPKQLPVTFSVAPFDTTYTLNVSGPVDVYATNLPTDPNGTNVSPLALPVPSYPTLSFNASSTAILSPPTAGAWYLFTADLINGGATQCSVDLTLSGSPVGWISTTALEASGGIDHVDLRGYRITTALTVNFVVAGTGPSFSLRYAPGP